MKRGKEELISGKKLKFFVCGPTVYDYSHIGHARTYVSFDVIVKYLRHRGINVFYLQNITDIDDKIINRAKENNIDPMTMAREFAEEYFKDMKELGVDSVDKYAFATEYVQAIIKQVQNLIYKGFAYKLEDGIYFDLSKFEDYGKLSGKKEIGEEDAVSRIDDSVNKKNKGDFCLWKVSKEGEPSWDSPFGKGRPGWHIEDTAITETEFGPQYDVHGGARDLIFPHHEAEIAQMEASSGKIPFVRYWLHTGFLNVNGQKMSKSLGNFITIRDALKKYGKRVLRLFFLSTHYRSPIDFSDESVEAIKKSLERIDNFIDSMRDVNGEGEISGRINDFKDKFEESMNDDFNTPEALSVLFDFIRDVNRMRDQGLVNKETGEKIIEQMFEFNRFLGIMKEDTEEISDEIKKLVEKREDARKNKDFETSDKIRDELKEKGYCVEDSPSGPRCKKI